MLKVVFSFHLQAWLLSTAVKASPCLPTSITRFTAERKSGKEKTRSCSKETHTAKQWEGRRTLEHAEMFRASFPLRIFKTEEHMTIQSLRMYVHSSRKITLLAHPEQLYCFIEETHGHSGKRRTKDSRTEILAVQKGSVCQPNNPNANEIPNFCPLTVTAPSCYACQNGKKKSHTVNPLQIGAGQ